MSPTDLSEIELFPLSKQKVIYLGPFVFSLPFPKFRKQNFIYFLRKHVET